MLLRWLKLIISPSLLIFGKSLLLLHNTFNTGDYRWKTEDRTLTRGKKSSKLAIQCSITKNNTFPFLNRWIRLTLFSSRCVTSFVKILNSFSCDFFIKNKNKQDKGLGGLNRTNTPVVKNWTFSFTLILENINLFQVNSRKHRKWYEICSKLSGDAVQVTLL